VDPFFLFHRIAWTAKTSLKNVGRFRFHAHGLKIKAFEWPNGADLCYKCSCNEVQGKKHALFYCNGRSFGLCVKYKDLSRDIFMACHPFALSAQT